MKKKIRGRIIRILNESTVVINLGQIHGITNSSVFGILGEPEIVVDPFTEEELGTVSLVKGRVKAVTVSDKFTIASSKWDETYLSYSLLSRLPTSFPGMEEHTRNNDETLRVKREEIKPWRAISEDFVQLGDEVEVSIELPDETDDNDGEVESGNDKNDESEEAQMLNDE